MTIGGKIKEVISWRGISQKELAARLEIPYPTFNGYILGRHPMTLELTQRIADELGVSVFVLINREPLPVESLELTQEEREAVACYRLLTVEQREMIMQSIKLFIRQNGRKR